MTVVEILKAARALYEANPSHVPSGTAVAPGTVCMIYALCDAAPGDWAAQDAATVALERAIKLSSSTRWSGLVDWNAEHSTAEVLDGFDRAIAEVSS